MSFVWVLDEDARFTSVACPHCGRVGCVQANPTISTPGPHYKIAWYGLRYNTYTEYIEVDHRAPDQPTDEPVGVGDDYEKLRCTECNWQTEVGKEEDVGFALINEDTLHDRYWEVSGRNADKNQMSIYDVL